MWRPALLCLMLGFPARADLPQVVQDAFAAVFYHELAHALIDVLRLPVAGPEEDAADALSVLLIDRLLAEARAADVVRAYAMTFDLYAAEAERGGKLPPRGPHAMDRLRRDRLSCLFHAAAPATRAAFAPVDGAAPPCVGEWRRLRGRWDASLARRPPQDHGPGLRMVAQRPQDVLSGRIMAEARAFNAEFGLPQPVDVTVEPCGAPDAFYDPRARRIVMCDEYAEELDRLHHGRPMPRIGKSP